jgi:hypothetical protein
MTSILLDPTDRLEEQRHQLALRRFTSLDGVRVGLLVNGKRNSDVLLADIGELLGERFEVKNMETVRKPSSTRMSPLGLLDDLTGRFDVVITAIGD